MALRPELLPVVAPSLVAAALMLLLAGIVLWFNFHHRPIRAFALMLSLRGLALLTLSLGVAEGDPGAQRYLFDMYPYFILPLAVATAYFVAIYPALRRGVPVGALGSVPFLAAIALLDFLYLADHRMFSDLGAVLPGATPLDAPPGPLFVFVDLWDLAFAAGALVLARDAVRMPDSPRRRSVLLISLGLGLLALFDATSPLARFFAADPGPLYAYPLRPVVLSLLPLLLLGGAAVVVARAARSGALPPGTARRYLLALALPVASAALLWVTDAPSRGSLSIFLNGLWRLAFPVLVTVALLRHQLLDVDLKVKWTIKQSTVAAAFIGMFFVVSEAAQSYFSESLGPFLGIAAAGALVFALAPLQRVAERVATVAVPGARPLQDLSPGERAHIYLDNARVAWADGVLDRNERAMLDRLRDSLGLSVEDAVRLEQQAARPG